MVWKESNDEGKELSHPTKDVCVLLRVVSDNQSVFTLNVICPCFLHHSPKCAHCITVCVRNMYSECN